MKVYEATLKPNSDGVFSISLVNDPATTETFIALSKQSEIKLAEVDKEQRILMGLVLQPDQLIYRKQNDEEFNIVFSADTIKELSHNFFKSGFQLNSKLEHEEPIKGVSIVESWLIENSKIDKSTNFGMEYPKGTWMATMKIDNDEIWEDYVKTGKVQGFSVDAFIDLEEVQLNRNQKTNDMESKTIVETIKKTITELMKPKEKELKSVKSGDTEIFFEGEKLEAGVKVFLKKDDKQVPLEKGEYKLEKTTLTVEEDGTAKKVEGPVEVVPEGMTEETAQAIGEAIANAIGTLKEEHEIKLKAIEDKNKVLEAKLTELEKQPAADAVTMAAQAVANATPLDGTGKVLQAIRNAG